MKSQFTITELGPENWTVLRDLKLRSLDHEPLAFEDVEEGRKKYLARSEQEWKDNLNGKGGSGQKLFFFAKDENGKYIGMVSSLIENDTATIQHMYVDPDYRGLKLGKKLMEALIDKLRKDKNISRILLQVLTTQEAAIGLYHSLGFQDIGISKVKRGEIEYDEIEMELIQ